MKTPEEALAWFREHRIVMEAARVEGVPSLAHAVVGGPFKGSWWGHPKGKLIFALANALEDTGELVALKLIEGKTTYVHKALWPALLCAVTGGDVAEELRVHRKSVHTESGKHVKVEQSWAAWAKEHGVTARKGAREDAIAELEATAHLSLPALRKPA